MEKVGLIDADLIDKGTRHPNLALMKISAYNKKKGNQTELLLNYNEIADYDKVFISKVFSSTKFPEKIKNMKNVTYGGTGFYEDGGPMLKNDIEHMKPDYDLYKSYAYKKIELGDKRSKYRDYLDYSIGFHTRGCFRKCSFCVNKKYDSVFKHTEVSEFYEESKPYIYLWDDNFLGYKNWKASLEKLMQFNKPFQFRQGLDIRLMTESKAKMLSKVRYHGDFIFAFDHIEDQKLIKKKLKIWKKHVRKTTKLYVLCAYDSQDINDITSVFERIKILMEHGCLPYIMRYNSYLDSPFKNMYIQLARWCNQPRFFKKMSFREFAHANQKLHKNTNTLCSTYKVLEEFETNYPDFVKQYFDLKYENLNQYQQKGGTADNDE